MVHGSMQKGLSKTLDESSSGPFGFAYRVPDCLHRSGYGRALVEHQQVLRQLLRLVGSGVGHKICQVLAHPPLFFLDYRQRRVGRIGELYRGVDEGAPRGSRTPSTPLEHRTSKEVDPSGTRPGALRPPLATCASALPGREGRRQRACPWSRSSCTASPWRRPLAQLWCLLRRPEYPPRRTAPRQPREFARQQDSSAERPSPSCPWSSPPLLHPPCL